MSETELPRLRVSAELREAVREAAARSRTTVADYVRRSIYERLDRECPGWDAREEEKDSVD